jgi:hypothetical protein
VIRTELWGPPSNIRDGGNGEGDREVTREIEEN